MTNLSIFLGILSSFFGALNGVYIKKTINILNNNLWEMNLLTNLVTLIVLLPLIYIFDEVNNIVEFKGLWLLSFWYALFISGLFGFLLGLAISFQIKVTSPLTSNISGVAKSCIQTVAGVIYYVEFKTLIWWLSNFFVLAGATLYSFARNQQISNTKPVHPI